MRRTSALALAAVLVGGATSVPTASAAEAAPIGFASVTALGQSGSTGGAGGPEVTVSTAAG